MANGDKIIEEVPKAKTKNDILYDEIVAAKGPEKEGLPKWREAAKAKGWPEKTVIIWN